MTTTATTTDRPGRHPHAFIGVLGYRRSRRNILGMQARLVTIHDGVLTVSDRDGEENERVDVATATVELKRGLGRADSRPGRALTAAAVYRS